MITLHGHEVAYRELEPKGGETGVVVLLHGIAGSAQTWLPVLDVLSRRSRRPRFIAPDLLGHGMSAKPRGDYSLGAYASGVRDLLAALGHSHATVVGHSLGGGIALQFAYQFPQNCERLILVASGGLGRTVSPLLRSVVLPGAGLVLPVVTHPRLSEVAGWIVRRAAKLQRLSEVTVRESVRHFSSLADPDRRKAFLCTARAVLDIGGQRIDARDRLYLASSMPTMLLWGSRDPVIPLRHGRRAAALMPGSRLEIFENSGHFPHCDEPDRFSAALLSFLRRTDPARLGIDDLSVKLTADTASWRGTATA